MTSATLINAPLNIQKPVVIAALMVNATLLVYRMKLQYQGVIFIRHVLVEEEKES